MALRDSATTQDDGFREIQLTGKQLVFLFMATTVVSIVIFLCGVLVGRGVRGDVMVAERSTSTVSPSEPPAGDPEPVDETVTAEDVKNPTPLPLELSYQQRLDGSGAAAATKSAPAAAPPAAASAAMPAPTTATAAASTAAPRPTPATKPTPAPSAPVEASKAATTPAAPKSTPAAPVPAPAAAASKAPASATPALPPASAASKPTLPPAAESPSGGQFVVQVAALADRKEADQVAQKLSAKGYAAFVLEPAADAKDRFYRVRIGRFADRPTAERTVKQLAQEGPYKPWITR
jgi:cell division septation protein DedD